MDVLQKRFPFRLLPILPPKKFGGGTFRSGRSSFILSGDTLFLEARRKGLKRVLDFLANHPLLKDVDIVVLFFTLSEVCLSP